MIEIVEESNLQYKGHSLQYSKYGVIVRNSSGDMVGEFDSDTEAYEYIDNIGEKSGIQESSSDKYRYLIYAKDEPYTNNRALFLRRGKPARFCYEADADTFSYEEMTKVTSNTNGKHIWESKKVRGKING